MLINKINAEFEELNKVIGNNILFLYASRLLTNREELRNVLLSMSADIREISRIEVILENKEFESKIVKGISYECIDCIRNIYKQYDKLVGVISGKNKESGLKLKVEEEEDPAKDVFDAIRELDRVRSKAKLANEIVSSIMMEMWEPLPNDKKEDNVNNIIVSSDTRSMSLNNVSNDVNNLDQFFNNICILVDRDKNKDNNIYLRKVETGSLTVVVSCVMEITPIIAFMFWCIKLCQKTVTRSLDNEAKRLDNEAKRLEIKEKRLKYINDEMPMAKENLGIKPDNKEADEIIQRCAIHIWDFLENNPRGTINGKHYDIGIENPKIEDKENK